MKIHCLWINSTAPFMWTILPLEPRLRTNLWIIHKVNAMYTSKVSVQLLYLQARVFFQEHQVSRVPAPHSELIICEYKSCTKNTLGEKLDRPECVKVLIVKWKPVHDVLICDLSDLYKAVSKMKPTKRNFIGLTARAYDPLGFLSQDASNCCSRTSV